VDLAPSVEEARGAEDDDRFRCEESGDERGDKEGHDAHATLL